MELTLLLKRQIEDLLPQSLRDSDALEPFIHAVNESYNAYELEKEMSLQPAAAYDPGYAGFDNQLAENITAEIQLIDTLKGLVTASRQSSIADTRYEHELQQVIAYLQRRIDGHKETEKKLQYQKAFYEQILNQIPADIAIIDRQHRYLYANPGAIQDPELRKWIIGKTDLEYAAYCNLPAAAAEEKRRHFDETVATKQQKTWEEKTSGPDGKPEYRLRMLFPVMGQDNELDIMINYGIDITERKKNEELLQQNESKLRRLFNHGQALICTHDINGRVLSINHACATVLGYKEEELIGGSLGKILPPDKKQDFDKVYLAEIRKNGKSEGVMVAMSPHGRKIYLLYQNYLVTDENDEPYVIGFSQDITARIEAERALMKSEEKYRRIIANMKLGLIEVDPQERIVYANNSFCEMSGYPIDEAIGAHASNMLLKDSQYTGEQITHSRQQGQSDVYELMIHTKQGEEKWWLVSGAPMFDERGEFKGSIGIHLDITLQKNLERDLRKAKSDAERSAHAKELFLANMSHEIRTPMNAVLGITRLLEKTQLDSQQSFYLTTIQNAANNLLVLINDLLDFSKIEAGKIDLEHIGFRLEHVVGGAVQMLRHKAEEKQLNISYELPGNTASVFLGDPYRINQVLMNLLSNALKFTEQGHVKISCAVLKDNANSQEVQFRVQDTGIGISDDFLRHLFDKFTQEDETITRKFGGTGLGMSICKQLVELMGGTIHAESRKNEGTVISFTLVLQKGTAGDLPQNRNHKVDTGILNGKRILLVEDNPINRLVARTVLKQYGAVVTEAEDGTVAIARFENNVFDLVLMDVQMPEKDGLETTRYIRSYIDNSIPIIALTANAFREEEERCLEAGMNDFISKPFDENQMVQLIARWLGREI